MDQQAELRWSSYLDEIRGVLSPLPLNELEDIIEELESHLSSEVDSNETRLCEADIEIVIQRLGLPQHMAEAYGIEPPNEEISTLDLSLLFTSLLLFIVGTLIPVMEIALLPAGAVLARICLMRPTVLASPYRFLGYPALLAGYTALILLSLLWPLIPVLPLAATGGLLHQVIPEAAITMERDSSGYWIGIWCLAAICTGLWWQFLQRLLSQREALLQRLFQPFIPVNGFPVARTRLIMRWAGLALIILALLTAIFRRLS